MKGPQRFMSTALVGVFVLAGLQLFSGLLLHTQYHPNLSQAYSSARGIHEHWFWGSLSRFHYWGAQISIGVCFLLIVVGVWTGWYRKPNAALWYSLLLTTFGSYLACFSGNLLPMDRHGVQSIVAEAGVSARAPFVGSDLRSAILQGLGFNQATLTSWYTIHRWVLLSCFLVSIAIYVITTLRNKSGTVQLAGVFAPSAIVLALAIVFAGPHGSTATKLDFELSTAPPNWYAWPLHGSLRMIESIDARAGWIAIAAIPSLLGLFLVLLPLLATKIADLLPRAILFFSLVFYGLAGYFFGGKAGAITGNRDPQEVQSATRRPEPTPTEPVNTTLVLKGKAVFDRVGCRNCHTIDGEGGSVGPVLEREWKKGHTTEWFANFIRNPDKVRPGTTMPTFSKLTDDEIRSIAEYIRKRR